MTGGVDTGDHAHALLFGVFNDGVHLRLGQLIGIKVVIRLVAAVDGRLNRFTLIGRFADLQRHIIQQEAQAVVAHRQLDIVKAGSESIVDERLDAFYRIVLSAAVQEENVISIFLRLPSRRYRGLIAQRSVIYRTGRRVGRVGSHCGNRQGAEHQHRREQDRKEPG